MKTHRVLTLIATALFIVSCSSKPNGNFILKGNVKGLKKGNVYLQKDGDSTRVNIDSFSVSGHDTFTLSTTIDEPLVLYLKLFKSNNEPLIIPFFADKGTTEINTSLKQFNFDAVIKGSKQQALLDEYLKVMKRYNDTNLDLIKARFDAIKANNKTAQDSLTKRAENIFKLKYAYTINFALNNNDNEISPYLALYELPDANPKFIDSIYNNLNDNIKQSYYGKQLKARLKN